MKHLIIIICAIGLVACKQPVGDTASDSDATIIDGIDVSEYTKIGKKTLVDVENGNYILGGSAHPTLYGDSVDYLDGSYKAAHWVNSLVVIEQGTVDFIERVVHDHDLQTSTYSYHAVFTPTSYNPSNCGYSMAQYEMPYSWQANGSILTQYFALVTTSNIVADGFTQTVDFPYTPDYAESNLTPTCL